MKYIVTTDTHFGHESMHSKANREVGFEGRIIEGITKKLRSTGYSPVTFIHLGDVAVTGPAELEYAWHERLLWAVRIATGCRAKCWLVMGNHDSRSVDRYRELGWDFAGEQVHLSVLGRKVALSHEPLPYGSHHPFDLNVHGHLHEMVHRREEFGIEFQLHRNLLLFTDRKDASAWDLETLVKAYVKGGRGMPPVAGAELLSHRCK